MILSLITALILSSPAHAESAVATDQKVSFSVSELTGINGHTYYSCDGLEDLTSSMLKKLGASQVRVVCSGGLDNGNYWGTPSLTAKFVAPISGSGDGSRAASYRSVSLRGSDNCAAANEIFAAIAPKLDLARVDGQEANCDSHDSYRIETEALMFN